MTAVAWLRKGDRWIPALFVGGFLVVLLVNLTMIWLAVGSFGGLATGDYYDRGRTYNETLATAEAMAELGWSADVVVERAGDVERITVTAIGRDGSPLPGATVTGRLLRPADEEQDTDVVFVHRGSGVWVAEVPDPAPGLWELRLVIARDGHAIAAEHRLILGS
ncbi:MAG: FixH family protein [Rhodospirillales bacterium]|nr:FixH family protein [Rhodospirillales bacterium]